jgi:hypothetical protein
MVAKTGITTQRGGGYLLTVSKMGRTRRWVPPRCGENRNNTTRRWVPPRCVENGRWRHEKHTQMGVFFVFEGMGRVREAANT